MNIEEIKQYLEENKENEEVKGLITQYAPQQEGNKDVEITPEMIKEFVNTHEQEAWGALQGWYDKNFEKSLATWKGKHLQGIIDEAVRAANPDDTPEQKRIRALEEKLAAQEAQRTQAERKALAISTCNRYGLPESLWTSVIGETEESMRNNASRIEMDFKSAIENEVEKRMSKGYRPRGGSDSSKSVEQRYSEAIKKGNPMDVLAAKMSARER